VPIFIGPAESFTLRRSDENPATSERITLPEGARSLRENGAGSDGVFGIKPEIVITEFSGMSMFDRIVTVKVLI